MSVKTPQVQVLPALTGVAVVAGAVAAGIGALSLADALFATGLPDPGPVTTYGLPFIRAMGEMAAVIAVGSFLLAAFLVPPQGSGVLDAAGYRSLRLGTIASGVWAVCAALLVPLTVSDVSGQPLLSSLNPATVWPVVGFVETASAWRWTAIFAAAVTLASIPVLRWAWTPFLLIASLASFAPLILAGHSSAGGAHDIATNSLLIHVVGAALWAGGVCALLAHAMRGGDHADIAAQRFSLLASGCFVAVATSGLLNALIRVPLGEMVDSRYGALVIVKAAALGLLGILGWRQRRVGIAALRADPRRRGPLIRLALTETLVFGITFGVAVGLGRTPPPASATNDVSATAAAIGYDLAGPPTVARIVFDWRFDLLFGTAAIGMALIYLAGVHRLRRGGHRWPPGRTVCWLSGCAAVLFATSSGIGRYLPAMFSMHMVAVMVLSLLAPILLTRGAPITLASRTLRAADRVDQPGLREWMSTALHSAPTRFFTHPVVATSLFVAGFYGVYVSGVFAIVADSHVAHIVMNAYFLVTGYLLFWVAIGTDRGPRGRMRPRATFAMTFAVLVSQACFGAWLICTDTVVAETFYRSLKLGWHTNLMEDQRSSGGIAWAIGQILLIFVVAVLAVRRQRTDQPTEPQVSATVPTEDSDAVPAATEIR